MRSAFASAAWRPAASAVVCVYAASSLRSPRGVKKWSSRPLSARAARRAVRMHRIDTEYAQR